MYSLNPLYIIITHASGYIEEKDTNKHLIFDSTDENKEFKFEPYLCNGCHDLMQKAMSFNNIAIVYVKENAYRVNFWYMSKDDAINIFFT